MKKRFSWILFVVCLAIFVALRLLPAKKGASEVTEKVRPIVPAPILSHPWLDTQPNVMRPNLEMMRDLSLLSEICDSLHSELTHEQIETSLIQTLTALQAQIPFTLPQELYSVLCISEPLLDTIKPPVPFQVYKRLYLGETVIGFPFYLDVRVFELDRCGSEELIAWHLETLDGEPSCLYQSDNRAIYTSSGERTRATAHGFATGKRGLFFECLEHKGRLFVLYAEAPIKNFKEHESLFTQLAQRAQNE